jgi:hypothetical protein
MPTWVHARGHVHGSARIRARGPAGLASLAWSEWRLVGLGGEYYIPIYIYIYLCVCRIRMTSVGKATLVGGTRHQCRSALRSTLIAQTNTGILDTSVGL